MKTFLLFTLVTLCITNHVNAEKQTHFETIMNAYVDVFNFSGTVMIQQSGEGGFVRSYGLANRSFDVPNTADTRYSINSVSKLFTTVLVLQLQEQGSLDLNQTIKHYLPSFDAEWAAKITLHQLLSHRSGLPRESGIKASDQMSFKEHLDQFHEQNLLFKPGAKYAYSNFGITVLGAIIEEVTGKSLGVLINEKISLPLSLTNTGAYLGKAVVKNQAVPYRISANGIIEEQRTKHFGDNAGGGLYSTPADLYVFIKSIFEHKLLKKDSVELMLKNHSDESEEAFAYGFSIQKFGADTLYLAAGSGYGTKSVVIYSPEQDLYIGINSNWGNTPIFEILRNLYLHTQGQTTSLPEQISLASPASYRQFLGTYQFDPATVNKHLQVESSTFVLHEVDGKLFLNDELLVEKSQGELGFIYTDELRIQFPVVEQMKIIINDNVLTGNRAP